MVLPYFLVGGAYFVCENGDGTSPVPLDDGGDGGSIL